jgi:23S rRNA (uracil1939-C5)-methyltransferase
MMPGFAVDVDRVATGGAGLGRGPDGRVVFVAGALPGERVTVEVTAEHRSRIEAQATGVVVASPGRRRPPCPHVTDGCGGCDWQHATPATQRALRRAIVDDCLRRLGGLNGVDIGSGPELASDGYRTTVRAGVERGRAGLRRVRSHEVIEIDRCLIAHPLVEEILVDGRFPGASEVTVRAGARTGERLVVVSPSVGGASVPGGVEVVGADELRAGRQAHLHEEVGGRRFRISALSFFQCRPDGAEVLVELARSMLAGQPGPLLDAYCGVGLFGALLGGGRDVVGVESSRESVADATVNYADHQRVVRSKVERWRPEPVGAIVADPARTGLGRRAVTTLASTGAAVLVLVSCDPASLARDSALLVASGYDLERVTVVDLFGQSSHVETVSRFVRR